MPLLTFDEGIVVDLELLKTVPPETANEFGLAAAKFLLKGTKPAALRRVAGALGVEADAVEAAVSAAARIMLEAARTRLHERDFVASVRETGLSAAVAASLWAAYDAARMELEDAASRSTSALPTLQGLEWRLELEVASRTRRAALPLAASTDEAAGDADIAAESSTTTAVIESAVPVPSFLLRLDTVAPASAASAGESAGGLAQLQEEHRVKSQYATCDYATLAMLKSQLEAALAEASSAHAGRVQRYLR